MLNKTSNNLKHIFGVIILKNGKLFYLLHLAINDVTIWINCIKLIIHTVQILIYITHIL